MKNATTVTDVQLCANQAIGVSGCTTGDINVLLNKKCGARSAECGRRKKIFFKKGPRPPSALRAPHSALVFVVFLLCGAVSAQAATINAASCAQSAVQTAINSAASGDTVALPAPCSATWSTTVTIPNTKGITLDGKGANITRAASLGNQVSALSMSAQDSVSTRITNFNFSGSASNLNERFIGIGTDSTGSSAPFRLDHTTFDGDTIGVHVLVTGTGYGLIDHCTFLWNGNNEVIQHQAYGFNSTAGWSNDVNRGSDEALYVEDSIFDNRSAPNFLGGKTAAFYGSRTVYRFNTMHNMVIDQHGTPGNIGARWWEIYNNTFTLNNGENVDKWLQIRAGTGMIFSNAAPSTGGGGRALIFWEEDAGYPALYQVGRGKNQTLDPAYVWLRDPDMPMGVDEASPNQIVANRDYYAQGASFNGTAGVGVGTLALRPATCTAGVAYWATDQGEWWAGNSGSDGQLYKCTSTNTWTLYYTPYIYPHPLQGGVPPAPPPPCDVNGDASTNVVDVQLAVNQALGATCTADINQDGVCNVVDVQRVVNAALGGSCVTQ